MTLNDRDWTPNTSLVADILKSAKPGDLVPVVDRVDGPNNTIHYVYFSLQSDGSLLPLYETDEEIHCSIQE